MSAELAATYDLVADDYAQRLGNELDGKPFDRALLDAFAAKVGEGVLADVGCGPGHVAAYLRGQGATGALGVDLSPKMVATARARHPDIDFQVDDMTRLQVAADSWDAIVAFYAIVHLRTPALGPVFKEFARVVRPGGLLLLSFHVGTEVNHMDEWWGHDVDVDFYFHPTDGVVQALIQAGWTVVACQERDPYSEDVEYPSRRAYVLARSPSS